MTTTSAPTTVKPDANGGTFETIAYHASWFEAGVAVTRRVGHRGNVWFEVARCRGDVMHPMARVATEREARDLANIEWLSQREALRPAWA